MMAENDAGKKVKDTARRAYRKGKRVARRLKKQATTWKSSRLDERERRHLVKLALENAKRDGCEFLFSVVVPVYNAELYVEETVESIVNQTVGFDHTQIILVNDGSVDNSEAVCQRLAQQYPKNIVYVSQENKGVSAARNHGLQYSKGYYVGFLDSDDLISDDYYEELIKFSLSHPDIEVFTTKTKLFGRIDKAHVLNFICKETAVIDVMHQYGFGPLSATRSYFVHRALEGHEFDERLKYTEDSLFVSLVLIEKLRFGALSKPLYFYRKREDETSATDSHTKTSYWYTEVFKLSHKVLLEAANDAFGFVPRFFQNTIVYDLYWRLRVTPSEEIPQDVIDTYRTEFSELLQSIEDEIILGMRGFPVFQRVFMLSLKYGVSYDTMCAAGRTLDSGIAYDMEKITGEQRVVRAPIAASWARTTIEIMETVDNGAGLLFEGRVPTMHVDPSLVRVVFTDGSHEYEAEVYPFPNECVRIQYDASILPPQVAYRVVVPVTEGLVLSAYVSYGGGDLVPLALRFGKYGRLNNDLIDTSYVVLRGGVFVRFHEGEHAVFASNEIPGEDELAQLEEKHLAAMLKSKKWKKWVPIRKYAVEHKKQYPDERIWMFSDRVTSAEDSGEVMFKYVVEHPIPNVRPIFILREDCPDFERLKKVGEVVAAGSEEHHRAFICADKVISSSADEWLVNPFGLGWWGLNDVDQYEFVFLQHGVIKESLSNWLYRTKKNIRLFVTSAEREKQSIVDGDYGYSDKQVILTGLPRWDSFASYTGDAKRVIYLMPTWRSYLSAGYNWDAQSAEEINALVEDFTESDYFKFFQSILEDAELQALLEEHDYVLKFAPHPRIGGAISAFAHSDRVQVLVPERFVYADAYKEMSMLITDYSSVAFNVAIMKKPVMYVQFDREDFYEGHTGTKDYFEYDTDGFGPVVTTKEQVIDQIRLHLAAGMEMPEEYRSRVEEFFFWPPSDEPRAKLVLDEIMGLQNS